MVQRRIIELTNRISCVLGAVVGVCGWCVAQDFLFHIICISVLDVYADLVESLAVNAFSLHSTGE
jgi:hypothetical protein